MSETKQYLESDIALCQFCGSLFEIIIHQIYTPPEPKMDGIPITDNSLRCSNVHCPTRRSYVGPTRRLVEEVAKGVLKKDLAEVMHVRELVRRAGAARIKNMMADLETRYQAGEFTKAAFDNGMRQLNEAYKKFQHPAFYFVQGLHTEDPCVECKQGETSCIQCGYVDGKINELVQIYKDNHRQETPDHKSAYVPDENHFQNFVATMRESFARHYAEAMRQIADLERQNKEDEKKTIRAKYAKGFHGNC